MKITVSNDRKLEFLPVLIEIEVTDPDMLHAIKYFSQRTIVVPSAIASDTRYGAADHSTKKDIAARTKTFQNVLNAAIRKFEKREALGQ